MKPRGPKSRAGGSCLCRTSGWRRQPVCLSAAPTDSVIRNSGPGVKMGSADDKMRTYGAPGVIEQPERRSRGVKIHGFRNPNMVPGAITAMSAVGGSADGMATWSDSLLLAKRRSSPTSARRSGFAPVVGPVTASIDAAVYR